VQSGEGNYQLQMGAPVTAFSIFGQYRYYTMTVDDEQIEDVSIILTQLNGNTDFYVSTETKRPTSEIFQWESKDGALTISKDDPYFVHTGIYFVGVRGLDKNNEYSIVTEKVTSSEDTRPIILSIDRKQTAVVVSEMKKNLYSFRTDSKLKRSGLVLVFKVQVLQGSLTLYYHNDDIIPSKDHTMETLENAVDDFHAIINNPCKLCEYLILIMAKQGTIYSLTVEAKKLKKEAEYTKRSKPLIRFLYFAIILIILIFVIFAGYCIRKMHRLRRELDLTELELNQQGVEGPRQRRKQEEEKAGGNTTEWSRFVSRGRYEALVLDGETDLPTPTDKTPMLS